MAIVTTAGNPAARMLSRAICASPTHEIVSAMTRSTDGLRRPCHLLVEHRPHRRPRLGAVGLVEVRIADVAGEQRAGVAGDRGGELESRSVERLEQVLLADDSQLLAVPVVGERLDDVRAGVHELSVQGGDLVGVIEHGLGNERPGLEVAATLQLEEVALGADHRSGGEPLG